jgi:hypothetical protein
VRPTLCCPCKQVAATLPFNLASAITFSLIAYGMAGLHHSVYAAGMNCAVCCLVLMISQQVSHHRSCPAARDLPAGDPSHIVTYRISHELLQAAAERMGAATCFTMYATWAC